MDCPLDTDVLERKRACLREAPEKDDSESIVDDIDRDVVRSHLANFLDSAFSSDMMQNDMDTEEHREEDVAKMTCPGEDRVLCSTWSGAGHHSVSPDSAMNTTVGNSITTDDNIGSQLDNRMKRKSKIISHLERHALIAVACGAQQWDHQFLLGEQLANPDDGPVQNTLVNGKLKPDDVFIQLSSPAQRALRKQWDSLVSSEGVMYQEFVEVNSKVQFYQLTQPLSPK